MSPARLSKGAMGDARNRRVIAAKYLEVAEIAATEEGAAANNVVVGVAVLAGIAASDAICLAATGARHAGDSHDEAAKLLARVDRHLGEELSKLVRLKPGAHYGSRFIGNEERTRALRAASVLVAAATERTLGA